MASVCLLAACATTPAPPTALEQVDAGLAYLANGQCDEAFARLSHALEFGGDLPHAHNGLGLIAMQCDGDFDRAAQHFKDAIAIDADFVAARTNLGVTFLERTPPRLDAACDLFASALEIAPSAIEPRENLVRCHLRRAVAGEDASLGAAYHHARILVEIAPERATAHELLGAIHLRREELEAGARRLRHCIDLAPHRGRCHYYLAHAHLARERCEEAMGAFVAALTSDDAEAIEVEVRRDLRTASFSCALADEALVRALDDLRARPSDPQAHVNLAWILERKGWFAQAEDAWSTVVKLAPEWCSAHLALVRAADRQLDSKAYVEHCRAYTMCPDHVEAEAAACQDGVRRIVDGDAPRRFSGL